ncbi:MAG: preprotein translocase subunit SecA [Candidatus Berkelbacteria bacterium]
MSILDFFYNPSKRVLSSLQSKVDQINEMEKTVSLLSDADLKAKTADFRKKIDERVSGSHEPEDRRQPEGEIIEEILPEAFAVMREAMKRVWGERHFDVQLIGGLVLHEGKIAEMRTGEGKTIVAALPIYLNALVGRGVHLVTVNDYLSKHQGEGIGEVYDFLGLSTGIIQSNQVSYKFKKNKKYDHYSACDGENLEQCSRKEAYACDVTYGTNNEFGFDYLRDNMAPSVELCSQREQYFAIVDEVDSILIDEARTPLIISAPAEESTSLYQRFAGVVSGLKEENDYTVDEKDRAVMLTDAGLSRVEGALGIANVYESADMAMAHHLEQALKAKALFKKDRDYVVREGEIVIVDEFTGRLMVGRRYSEGLHQAIEAKEKVEVNKESQTLATISFQNLFRMYNKLAGMTGTASTEAEEFYKIYKLDVVEIPTNKAVQRLDLPDRIYKTEKGKFEAIVLEVKERTEKGQPILIGTASVTKNEMMSKMLKTAGLKHEILNAKNHEREAKIISKAGQKGAVTVATNMAGRGTDIKLGEGVREVGGLHVIGSERHEARRIDNQLRGRAGRQGDTGSSQFFVSMEDDLMRIFGGDRLKNLMESLGLPDDMPIENKMISGSIESAQKRVEGNNFDTRKHLVDYDDVMNKQREVIYKKRRKILEMDSTDSDHWLKDEIVGIVKDEIEKIYSLYSDNRELFEQNIKNIFGEMEVTGLDIDKAKSLATEIYEVKEKEMGSEVMRQLEKMIYLRTIDLLWVEHLTTMDELRAGIGLVGYSQRDPLVEYKQQAHGYFESLLATIETNVARTIFRARIEISSSQAENTGKTDEAVQKVAKNIDKGKTVFDRMKDNNSVANNTVSAHTKVGRNDACPCGAKHSDGRPIKYKHCCGK